MKVMILTDLEGPSGVNGRPDNRGMGIAYPLLNQETAEAALVNEVNACCDGLIAAGADEIVVFDGHGGSSSIDIFKLHPKARLLQIGNWMPASEIDSTYAALVQIGTHAMQGSGGYLYHSFNGNAVQEMIFNGKPVGEIGIDSLRAAYFHVPTILVSGDETACQEARDFLGKAVVAVPTKFGVNRYSAVNYQPEQVYAELKRGAEMALKNRKKIPCPKIPKHCELIIRLMCPNQADAAEKIGIERLDEVTLRYKSDDFIDLWAQRLGWAPGVHNPKYGITPAWVHPYSKCQTAKCRKSKE